MAESETPITWEAPSFALFDADRNAVCTTPHGNLAIFSVAAVAREWAKKSNRNIKVIPVWIKPATPQ